MSWKQSRTVLFGECDPAGIMYTPCIADYVVEATLAFLSHRLGKPVERFMYGLGYSLPARALNMEFFKSMTWDEVIDIEVSIHEMRSRSFTVAVTGRNAGGDKTFQGHLTMVSMSPELGKAVTVPPELKKALEPAS
jgi:acyl-CoA thioesterase FadM